MVIPNSTHSAVYNSGKVTTKSEGQANIAATVDKQQFKYTITVVDSNKEQ